MDKLSLETTTRLYIQSIEPDARLERKADSWQIVWGPNHGPIQPDPTLAWLKAAGQIIDNEIGKLLY